MRKSQQTDPGNESNHQSRARQQAVLPPEGARLPRVDRTRRSGTTLAVTALALAGTGAAMWATLAAVFDGWQAAALVAASTALIAGTLGSVWAVGRLADSR